MILVDDRAFGDHLYNGSIFTSSNDLKDNYTKSEFAEKGLRKIN